MIKSHKAFTIIEILIAMLILFTAITFSSISIKAFNTYQRQSERYQDFYIVALSLKDKMSLLTEFKKMEYDGSFNGLGYSINIQELIKKRNYLLGQDGIGRNDGDFMLTLYRLTMILKKRGRAKKYTFLLTKEKLLK